MNKSEVVSRIKSVGIIPVIRTASAADALFAVEAVSGGGIPIVEITMTIPGAIDVIEKIAGDKGSGILVGAGTVLDAKQARDCLTAGAQFIVSPILDLEIVELCRQNEITVLAGALTPTEIFAARGAGADMIKIFPCGAVGGASYLKSIRAVFPLIDFVPTGGVSLDTAAGFARAGAAALGVGADLFGDQTNSSEDSSEIRKTVRTRVQQYLEIIRAARGAT